MSKNIYNKINKIKLSISECTKSWNITSITIILVSLTNPNEIIINVFIS